MQVGLTCDLGRRYDELWLEAEREVWPLVSHVSIPCGGHAGVPRSMLSAVTEATSRSLTIGATLGYRDPASGGERFIDYDSDDLAAELLFQLGGLESLVVSEGGRLQFVRTAGALGEAALTDRCHAWAVVNAVLDFDDSLVVVGQADSRLLATAQRHGLATAVEYQPHLTSRSAGVRAAARGTAELAERAVEAVAAGGVDLIWLPCGTTAERATLQAVHRALTSAGHSITPAATTPQVDEDVTRLCRRAG